MGETTSGIVFCDGSEIIVFATEGFLHLAGLSPEDLRSRKIKLSELSPPESAAADEQARQECLKTGWSPALEKEIIRGDGSRVPVLFQSVLNQDPQRRWTHFVVDLSELQRSAGYRRMLDHLAEGIWELDSQGLTTFMNLAMGELLGYRAEEVVGRRAFNLILDEDQSAAAGVLLPEKGGKAEKVDLRLRRKDGSPVFCSLTVRALSDDQGEPAGSVALVTDLTGRRLAEEEARRREEELRLIADRLPLLIAYLDSQERFRFANREFRRWFGESAGEVTGRRLREVLGERVYAQVRPRVETALSGKVADFEVNVRTLHQGECCLSATHLPHFGLRGQVEGFVVMMRDVTKFKREEQARRLLTDASAILSSTLDVQVALQRLTRLVVERLADRCLVDLIKEDGSIERQAIACADPAREARAWELTRRFPLSAGSPVGIGRVIYTAQPELHEEVGEEALRSFASGEEHFRDLRELGLKSLLVVPLSVRGRTLGALTLAIAESDRRFGREELELVQDLGARAANAVDNARLYQEAREANRMKDDFLAIVSHEIRAPLSSILGWAELLSAGGLAPERVEEAIETIQRSAKAQSRLIEDLLDISRIIRGKIEMNIGRLQLDPVIQEAIGSVVHQARTQGLEMIFRFDPQAPAVLGDAARLRQVVWNLLSNALKFTDRGGRVEVSLGRRGAWAEIVVRDTGRGISPQVLPRIFDPFHQGGAPAGSRGKGLGLGLAIVRHLVELHGGTVEAHSPGVGGGATFVVNLPPAPEDSAQSVSARVPSATGRLAAAAFLPSLRGLRILLVDDEADARRLILTVLEMCGAEALAVGSASEALHQLEIFRPEILLIDIGLPGETGWDLIRKIRSLEPERGGSIPAAAVTAYARYEDRLRSMEAGFQVHLAKPVEPTRLVETVASLASGRR